jgi:hypothetical protein
MNFSTLYFPKEGCPLTKYLQDLSIAQSNLVSKCRVSQALSLIHCIGALRWFSEDGQIGAQCAS